MPLLAETISGINHFFHGKYGRKARPVLPILKYNKVKFSTYIVSMLAALSLASCNVIYDGEGDCSYRYGVRFVYDWNIKFADAFPQEVKAVAVYAFDEQGVLVSRQESTISVLAEKGYVLPIELEPGTYDLVAWCTWDKSNQIETLPFDIPRLTPGQSTLDELTATLAREDESVLKDIDPLYHGYVQKVVFTTEEGDQIVTLPLMKNTNSIRIVLQQLNGDPILAEQFRFCIMSTNGRINYDNALLPDDRLCYNAWHLSQGSASMETAEGTVNVVTAVAELTTSRLVIEDQPHLYIFNDRGETVVSIPLIDYFLMVKGYYGREMGDQEFLDRQDEYSLTFFLDQSYTWDRTRILINSWAVVLNNGDVGQEKW